MSININNNITNIDNRYYNGGKENKTDSFLMHGNSLLRPMDSIPPDYQTDSRHTIPL